MSNSTDRPRQEMMVTGGSVPGPPCLFGHWRYRVRMEGKAVHRAELIVERQVAWHMEPCPDTKYQESLSVFR